MTDAETVVPTCRKGHPWTEENTLRRISSGRPIRQCRECARAAAAARKHRVTQAPATDDAAVPDGT